MFKGKKALVTGGSSGIGLATARLLAAQGAEVAILARDPERLELAREAIDAARAQGTPRVLTLSADVSDWEAVSKGIGRLAAEGFAPDILVNSAGVIIPGNFESMPLEHFRDTMEWDVMGLIYVTRAVVPHMIERGSGHIVNVSSVAGYVGVFGYTAYSAAKFAVMGFSESLRCEMKPLGIDVSVICPPDTDTPGLAFEKSLRPKETDEIAGIARAVAPEFIASHILKAIRRRRFLVLMGFENKLVYFLKGVAPSIVFAVWDSKVKKVVRGRADSPVSDEA